MAATVFADINWVHAVHKSWSVVWPMLRDVRFAMPPQERFADESGPSRGKMVVAILNTRDKVMELFGFRDRVRTIIWAWIHMYSAACFGRETCRRTRLGWGRQLTVFLPALLIRPEQGFDLLLRHGVTLLLILRGR